MKDKERDDLFARARREASPTREDQRRVRRALGRHLGAAAGTAAGVTVGTTALKAAASTVPAATNATAATAATVGTGLTALGAAKLAVAVVAVALVATSVSPPRAKPLAPKSAVSDVQVTPTRPESGQVRAPSPLPATSALPGSAAPRANVEVPALAPAPPSARPSLPGVRTGMSASLGPSERVGQDSVSTAEVALMEDVQSALRNDDPTKALDLVSEHEQRFPNSVLAPEREGARVLARCTLLSGAAPSTDGAGARSLGASFLRTHPLSPLAGRVRATCGLGTANR